MQVVSRGVSETGFDTTGYIGGKLDMMVQRVVDSVMCIPQLILMMVLITILGRDSNGGQP